MIEYWADTSALLHQNLSNVNIVIDTLTLSELENIKSNEKVSYEIKFKAREAVRAIIQNKTISVKFTNNRVIDKKLKKYPFLSNINDHRIICAAEIAAEEQNTDIKFLTNDATQYLCALQMPHLSPIYSSNEKITSDIWTGWGKYYPDENEMAMLYSDPQMNILKCKTNEFAEIYEGSELKDVLFWNGHCYTKLKYKNITNPYLKETISPRNLEQKMAFHLLQDNNIKLKLLTSAWGGGKTLMALSYALEQVYKGNYQKLVFIRNNIIVADTNDIGYLPGDRDEKMLIWGAPLADHLGGEDVLKQLIEDGVIEIYPLSHIRGRSLHDSIVICDECENMNDKLVTLLMSRIEDSSELIFCGDIAQIDNKKFEQNNGIVSMLLHLAGNPLFGVVKLIKSERGGIPALCDLMRPPQ